MQKYINNSSVVSLTYDRWQHNHDNAAVWCCHLEKANVNTPGCERSSEKYQISFDRFMNVVHGSLRGRNSASVVHLSASFIYHLVHPYNLLMLFF